MQQGSTAEAHGSTPRRWDPRGGHDVTKTLFRHPLATLALACLVTWALLPTFVRADGGLVTALGSPGLQIVCVLLLATLALAANARGARSHLTSQEVCALLLATAFLLRACYVLYTTLLTRQHDAGNLLAYGGHRDYILWFADNGLSLPDFSPYSVWSFYNPPLHYVVAGAWVALQRMIGLPTGQALEGAQFLTLFYSCAFCVVGYRIMRLMHLDGRALTIPFALLCLSPSLVIMAGSINNDMLCALFMVVAVEMGLRWWKDPSTKGALAVALAAGLATATKTSGALVMPALLVLFVARLARDWGDAAARSQLLRQLGLCAVVFLPIAGLWTLWCALRWDVAPGTIQTLGTDELQYLGTGNYLARCLRVDETFLSPFVCWDYATGIVESNPTLALLKTALFDETAFFSDGSVGWWASAALSLVNVGVVAMGVWAGITGTVRALARRPVDVGRLSLVVLSVTCLFSYYSFAEQQPFVCTQNVRYVMPLLVSGTTLMGMWLAERDGQGDRHDAVADGGLAERGEADLPTRVLSTLTVAFCTLVVIVYLLLGAWGG